MLGRFELNRLSSPRPLGLSGWPHAGLLTNRSVTGQVENRSGRLSPQSSQARTTQADASPHPAHPRWDDIYWPIPVWILNIRVDNSSPVAVPEVRSVPTWRHWAACTGFYWFDAYWPWHMLSMAGMRWLLVEPVGCLEQASRSPLTQYVQEVGVSDGPVFVLHHAAVVPTVWGNHALHDQAPVLMSQL